MVPEELLITGPHRLAAAGADVEVIAGAATDQSRRPP